MDYPLEVTTIFRNYRSGIFQPFERRGTTRSHPELGSETRQRRQYLARKDPGRYLKAGKYLSGFFMPKGIF